MKTRTLATVTMRARGEFRIIYDTEKNVYRIRRKYYEPIDGRFKTNTVGKYPTLASALRIIAELADTFNL